MGIDKVYLDNSATTAVCKEAKEAMQPYFDEVYGNASSLHGFGQESKMALEQARSKIAELINAKPNEIIFTACGTESDNLAIFGTLNACGKKAHVITSKIEHHAVLHSFEHLQKTGYDVSFINVDKNGIVLMEEVKKVIKDETCLISIMHANNEVGSIQPIKEIAQIIKKENEGRKNKIYFHTDAVQTTGKLKIDVKDIGVDMLAMSAHKFNGPKGIGVLYVKEGTKIAPIIYGGHHENGLRPGTENVAYAVAMAKALEVSTQKIDEHQKHITQLKSMLKDGILKSIDEVIINGDTKESMPNILNVSFKYVEGEALLAMLDMHKIAASTGSACATGSNQPSHVLTAMGVDSLYAQSAIRFSFGYQNTKEEIEYVLKVLVKIVSNLRKMSPVYKGK